MMRPMTTPRHILVTGGGGFLGSVLVPLLLDHGYHVTVLDRFFFGRGTLAACSSNPRCKLVEADTRTAPETLFQGIDSVVDLAALSNDPLSELKPETTLDINFHARVRTATLAKRHGVGRYVLASTCSVYGFQNGVLTETAVLNPLTTYARAAARAEERTLALSDGTFAVTALRQGTLYGLSPRMRFDIVVNTLTLSLFRDGKLHLNGGDQWRPLLHVGDSARAFLAVLEAPPAAVGGQVFNVGATAQNFQLNHLATLIVRTLDIPPRIETTEAYDHRSYRTSSAKIERTLGFMTQKTPEHGAREVYGALRTGSVTAEKSTITLEWYKHLLSGDPGILDPRDISHTA